MLETRLVIPVSAKSKFEDKVIKNLNPVVQINSEFYIVLTQQMAAIPMKNLGNPICNCVSNRQEIISAIDFLITGF